MPKTVSIVVLTYNESSRLRACLESVAWADEIVIVDGYSTDNTVEIAREYTSHVHLSDLLGPKNPGGFSDQRNFGIDRATGDWIFFLDADERVTPELVAEIKARLLEADEGHAAYRFRRSEHFFGVPTPYTHGEAWMVRLIRNGQARWDGRLVHEGLNVDGTVGDLQSYLLHFSKDTVAQYVETMNRYTTLEAEENVRSNRPLARSPLRASSYAFFYRYWNMQSYKEGTFGLLMSLMFAFYQYLVWAKQWDITQRAGRIPGVSRPTAVGAVVGGLVGGVWRAFGKVKQGIRR